MDIVRSKKTLTEAIRALRSQGKTIALVPTMGALHAGHISLVRLALEHADVVAATIFVNPMQFGPHEDFAKYPRTEAEDVKKLAAAGAAVIYMPTVEEMYAPDAVTRVQILGIGNEMEGAFRPGFFEGVATVVTKLFMQVLPDVAVFGEKDYQQLHIIRTFTKDLDIPVKIIGAPLMREADGLAMASRNRYLNQEERAVAPSLYRVLSETAAQIKAADRAALSDAKNALLSAGFNKIDYVELRDAETLMPVTKLEKPARLLVAAYLGTTRLIDNIEVRP